MIDIPLIFRTPANETATEGYEGDQRPQLRIPLAHGHEAIAVLMVWSVFVCLSLFVQPNYDQASTAELLYYTIYNVVIGWFVGFYLFNRVADDGYALFATKAWAAIVSGTLVNEAIVEPVVFGLWHINGEGVYYGLKDALSSAGIFALLRLAQSMHALRHRGSSAQRTRGAADAGPAPAPLIGAAAGCFLARVRGGTRRIHARDVLYMEAERDFTRIVCAGGEHFVSESLKSLTSKCAELGLVRAHKSFAVNLSLVDGITGTEVRIGDCRVPLGRRYRPDFLRSWRTRSAD